MHTPDLIGIGFGPSNIALAIALEERKTARSGIEAFFIEKQPGFAWHVNMLLDNAHMQISFLKDLATLRNPASRFTFINYLHLVECPLFGFFTAGAPRTVNAGAGLKF